MEFIDFLKYGAIGISLVLAILSFRLLSKEQDAEAVRPAMLNSIRHYFYMAAFLSVFFGAMEFFKKTKIGDSTCAISEAKIDAFWHQNFSTEADSTLSQKLDRLLSKLNTSAGSIAVEDCSSLKSELKSCQEELGHYDTGFYPNIIKIQNELKKDPDGWTNLSTDIENKDEIFDALRQIFSSLGNPEIKTATKEEVSENWANLKSGWYKPEASKDHSKYIFPSDLSQVIRIYLKKYSSL